MMSNTDSTVQTNTTTATVAQTKPRTALSAAFSEIYNGRIRDLSKELRLAAREDRGFKIEMPPGVPSAMVTLFPDYQKYTDDVRKEKLLAEMAHKTSRLIIQAEREHFEKHGPRKISAEQQSELDKFMAKVKEDYHESYEECERLERKLRRRRNIASSLMAAAIDGSIQYSIYSSLLYAKQADMADNHPIEHLRGFQWIYSDLWEKFHDIQRDFSRAIHDSLIAEGDLLDATFEHMKRMDREEKAKEADATEAEVEGKAEKAEAEGNLSKFVNSLMDHISSVIAMEAEDEDEDEAKAEEPPHILALRARVRETSIQYNAKMDAYQAIRLKLMAEEYKIATSPTARIDSDLAKAAMESRKRLFKACQALGDLDDEGEVPNFFLNPVSRSASNKRKADQMEDENEDEDDDDESQIQFEVVEIARKSID